VRLEPGIRYTNEFFESEESEASGVIPRRFATLSKVGDALEMDNPFSGSCADGVVSVDWIYQDVKYHEHKWIALERGSRICDGSSGSPILNENGQVTAIFRFVDRESPNLGFALPGAEVEKLGLKLVDKHVF
jgi:S1-C subfamily serine protease